MSVRRLLREKFVLGLFDEPATSTPRRPTRVVGSARSSAPPATPPSAPSSSTRACTNGGGRPALPPAARPGPAALRGGRRARGRSAYGDVVDAPPRPSGDPAPAGAVRAARPGFEASSTPGRWSSPPTRSRASREIAAAVPTVVDMYLDRPAVLGGARRTRPPRSSCNFGVERRRAARRADAARRRAGRLPFDLPRSMAAVEASRSDVPFDTADPLFRFGHGLSEAGTRVKTSYRLA